MHVINARNVNSAYPQALHYIAIAGDRVASRNGPVLRAPEPVSTVYAKPWERVLFDPQRDANPFFHLFESLWMLDGRNDVATLTSWLATCATSLSKRSSTRCGSRRLRPRPATT